MKHSLAALAALALLALSSPIRAAAPPVQDAAVAEGFHDRLGDLIGYLNGDGRYAGLFAPTFRHAVPQAQFETYVAQLRQQGGRATGVEAITPATPWSAVVAIGYERAVVTMQIAVDPAGAHAITGLRITGATPRDDSPARIEADFRALPGGSGFGVYALGDDGVTPIAEVNAQAAAPLGSGFKLWVLAEAARAVRAGERRWDDVVPVGRHSLPSGILQDWPAGAPVTLQTLATLMISISDNTATDTLMRTLERDRIAAMVRRVGVADPDATLPLLTTMEAFALKSPRNARLATRWADATSPAARTRLLKDNARALAATPVDSQMFAGKPLAIDRIEWFASPRDMARTLDWLRRNGDATTRDILSVSHGTDPATAAKFAYLGFKGGSEPGVMTLNYLIRTSAGKWFAVTGNWHDASAPVEELTLVSLMNRLIAIAVH